jgi:hypothetical protein
LQSKSAILSVHFFQFFTQRKFYLSTKLTILPSFCKSTKEWNRVKSSDMFTVTSIKQLSDSVWRESVLSTTKIFICRILNRIFKRRSPLTFLHIWTCSSTFLQYIIQDPPKILKRSSQDLHKIFTRSSKIFKRSSKDFQKIFKRSSQDLQKTTQLQYPTFLPGD